jgi:hypothetical protein
MLLEMNLVQSPNLKPQTNPSSQLTISGPLDIQCDDYGDCQLPRELIAWVRTQRRVRAKSKKRSYKFRQIEKKKIRN